MVLKVNDVTVAKVTSVSRTELKTERDQFLIIVLSNYCAWLTAESKPPQTQNNSATSKTAAFQKFGLLLGNTKTALHICTAF